jgi:uncharacterized protein
MASSPWTAMVGSVSLLMHFPVKSTAGQSLSAAVVDDRGLVHDRQWAVYTADRGIASGKTTRRFRKVAGLMSWRSSVPATGSPDGIVPELHSPDGATYRVDDPAASDALTHALGQPLTLRREAVIRHHDESGVHLVTTSSIRRVEQLVGGQVDARRLRANIVLDTQGTGFLEGAWTDAELAIGTEVVLRLGPGMPRCVMIDQPQATVLTGPPVLQALGRSHNVLLGLQAHVIRPGTISLGDQAWLTAQ